MVRAGLLQLATPAALLALEPSMVRSSPRCRFHAILLFVVPDGTPFFNEADPFGTNTGGVHPAMYEVKPNSQFDSWLTINQDDGENKEKINSIGIEWDEFNAGGALKTSDGAVRGDDCWVLGAWCWVLLGPAGRERTGSFGAKHPSSPAAVLSSSPLARSLNLYLRQVFLMNPEDIPDFTGELPPEITDKTKRAVLLAQLTVTTGSTFSGHVNVQVRGAQFAHARGA